MRWSLLVIFLLSLTACGQKGNLYLPEKDAADKSAQDISLAKPFTRFVS